jgi:hypothetical protein
MFLKTNISWPWFTHGSISRSCVWSLIISIGPWNPGFSILGAFVCRRDVHEVTDACTSKHECTSDRGKTSRAWAWQNLFYGPSPSMFFRVTLSFRFFLCMYTSYHYLHYHLALRPSPIAIQGLSACELRMCLFRRQHEFRTQGVDPATMNILTCHEFDRSK